MKTPVCATTNNRLSSSSCLEVSYQRGCIWKKSWNDVKNLEEIQNVTAIEQKKRIEKNEKIWKKFEKESEKENSPKIKERKGK